jgi:uncharacterized protein YecE (DUF72 family)
MIATMIRAGTSGYNYDAWKGRFYPEDLPASKMLRHYASKLSTVEINYTFRRMPTEKAVTTWAAQVGADFRFALKAPFWIANQRKSSAKALAPFLELTSLLGARRGPILFQFPVGMKKDLPRLQSFLAAVPRGVKAAFDLQDESWQEDAVYQALADAGAALCLNDSSEIRTPVQKTAEWGYFRLRSEDYDKKAIARWRRRIEELKFTDDVFVYFRHEDTASGPRFAQQLLAA